jgi:dTMP kinase
VFITLEGIDRSGKSTQAKLLAEALGPRTLLVREPGGTAAGERVRELLTDPELKLDPLAELMMFCAARAQLVSEVIRPALEAGRDVVCDRFADSTVAYQGHARGLGAERAERACELATDGLAPDLTLLIRVDPEVAAARDGTSDRFEAEGAELQRAVAAGYEALAAAHPERIVVVDGEAPAEQVHAAVKEVVARRLGSDPSHPELRGNRQVWRGSDLFGGRSG